MRFPVGKLCKHVLRMNFNKISVFTGLHMHLKFTKVHVLGTSRYAAPGKMSHA